MMCALDYKADVLHSFSFWSAYSCGWILPTTESGQIYHLNLRSFTTLKAFSPQFYQPLLSILTNTLFLSIISLEMEPIRKTFRLRLHKGEKTDISTGFGLSFTPKPCFHHRKRLFLKTLKAKVEISDNFLITKVEITDNQLGETGLCFSNVTLCSRKRLTSCERPVVTVCLLSGTLLRWNSFKVVLDSEDSDWVMALSFSLHCRP